MSLLFQGVPLLPVLLVLLPLRCPGMIVLYCSLPEIAFGLFFVSWRTYRLFIYRFITSFPAGLPTDEEAAYFSLYAMHPKTFIFNYPGYFFFSCYCYLAFFLFFQDRFYPLTLYLVPIIINVYSLR